ncbi:MAG: hypothetical protein ABI345_09675 [Jatrophihabitans sp.]
MRNGELTSTPSAEDFRALARSSPWRFSTIHFTHRDLRDRDAGVHASVEAWLDRPAARVTVRCADCVDVSQGVPYSTSRVIFRLEGAAAEPEPKPEPEPWFRPDGLVEERPPHWQFDHGDPMWRDYQWTAMLDPYELSRGVDVEDVAAVTIQGRPTWSAICRPVMGEGEDWDGGYDPRCGCCPLLDSLASRFPEYGEGHSVLSEAEIPSAYRVWLDVGTAIVVRIEALDGHGGTVFSNEIHTVDEPIEAPAQTEPPDPPVRSWRAVPGRLRRDTPPQPPQG